MMRRLGRIVAVWMWVVLLPSAVFAQAGIAGNVKDTSGAVLPGVTVEAASPALIEKTRSAVTDGGGNYKIENLRPGTYTVTFTLPGFNTYKREGIELAGSFVASVNADMKVGAIEESITVTGETPLVDIQSTSRQSVLSKDVIDALPTGRSYSALGVLLPGLNGPTDVGASTGGGMATLTAHGGAGGDQRILQNGLNVMTLQTGGGNIGGMIPNQSGAQEVAIDTSGVSAERQTSGVAVNYIQRDGGNTFKSYSFFTYGGDNIYVANNLTDRLKTGRYAQDPNKLDAPGLSAVNALIKTWEINPGFGGPIKRDKLWFYYTVRYQRAQDYAAGMYQNLNAFILPTPGDVASLARSYTYKPDLTKQALSRDGWWDDSQLRLTWQMNAKNKFAGTWDQQAYCQCPNAINATRTPEAASDRRFPTQQLIHGEWFSPVTSRLLLEFVGLHRTERWGEMQLRNSSDTPTWPSFGGSFDRYFPASAYALYPQLIGVTEQNAVNNQAANLVYRGGPATFWNNNWVPSYHYRGSVSYVTGTHSFKVGFQEAQGFIESNNYNHTVPYRYRFKSPIDANGNITAANGLPTPNQVTAFATPYYFRNDQNHDLGLFAQDRWTLNRLTLSYGIRFDYFRSSYPAQTIPASTLFVGTSFARATPQTLSTADQGVGENLNWKDITPRFGGAYDVFGDGKTAIKFSVNKYVGGQTGNGNANTNPVSRLINSASRTWVDSNKDFVVGCDLTNPNAQNFAGGKAVNPALDACDAWGTGTGNFGTMIPTTPPQDAFRTGWNQRPYNWEFTAGVQRQLLPRVSAEVSYFRRVFGNFTVTDNLNLAASDFDQFNVVLPVDDRLGAASGQTITGLYDVKVASKAVATNNATILVDGTNLNGAKQYQHWNGVDVNLDARLANGITLRGGVATGRQYLNNCDVVAAVPESAGNTPLGYCSTTEPFLTQVKVIAIYTVPKIGVQVSGTFQSNPGSALQAVLTMDNAFLANPATSTLGRSLANGANKAVNMLNPGIPLYDERNNQLDMRFAKILKYGRTRTNVSVDLFNAFNNDTRTGESTAYETLWKPSSILQARFIKFSAQFDF